MDRKTLENIMEITSLFGYYNTSGKFKECTLAVSYFDQLKDVIENWTKEFEEGFNEDTMDYIHEIEVFTVKKFAEMGWLLEETMEKSESSNKDPLPLTVGTLRMLSEGKNIPPLKTLLEGKPDNQFLDLLNRDDYIATKLWSKEDIEAALEEKGYPVTEDNVNAVINSGMLKTLGDCTDGDWEIIYQAIDNCASGKTRR